MVASTWAYMAGARKSPNCKPTLPHSRAPSKASWRCRPTSSPRSTDTPSAPTAGAAARSFPCSPCCACAWPGSAAWRNGTLRRHPPVRGRYPRGCRSFVLIGTPVQRHGTLILLGVLLLSATLSMARAQGIFEKLVMPGPLIGAHAELEKTCKSCHEPFAQQSQSGLCMACHKPIAADRQAKRNYHGRHPEALKG